MNFAEYFKQNLSSVRLEKKDDDTEWITVHGQHIPIKAGQTAQEAMHAHFHGMKGGKKSKTTETHTKLTKKEHHAISRAVELTKEHGGATVRWDGKIPHKGFSFAPSKKTDTRVPQKKFNTAAAEEHFRHFYKEMHAKGAHIGMWVEEGKVCLDVSKVVQNENEAVKDAIKSKQDAIYDLGTGTTKRISDYKRKKDGDYTYGGTDGG